MIRFVSDPALHPKAHAALAVVSLALHTIANVMFADNLVSVVPFTGAFILSVPLLNLTALPYVSDTVSSVDGIYSAMLPFNPTNENVEGKKANCPPRMDGLS